MKKNIFLKSYFKVLKVAVTLIFLLSAQSCRDLVQAPIDNIGPDAAYSSQAKMLAAVIGCYGYAAGNIDGNSGENTTGIISGRNIVLGDMRGEDIVENGAFFGTVPILAQTVQNGVVADYWQKCYGLINRVNVTLAGISNNSSILSASDLAQYTGELKFLRALAYYNLVQYYARPFSDNNGNNPGVPLRLLAETSSANRNIGRATVAQVYTQMFQDLADAEAGCLSTFPSAVDRVSRATDGAVIALRIRLLMNQQNWSAAITECQKLVPGITAPFAAAAPYPFYALNASFATTFAAPYTSLESIFSGGMSTTANPGVNNSLNGHFIGQIHLKVDRTFAQSITPTTDARLGLIDPPASVTVRLLKYNNTVSPRSEWAPVFRYAEILLSYAECLVRNTNTVNTTAINLVNAVRVRSLGAGAAYTPASFANSTALLNAILSERRVEFLGEGLRFYDLARLGLPIVKRDGNGNPVPTVAWNGNLFVWPIPQAELDQNETIRSQQNPGY
jgi:hypothetical protein